MKKIITLLFLFIIPTAQGMLEPPDPQTIDDLPTYCAFFADQLEQMPPFINSPVPGGTPRTQLPLCSVRGPEAHISRIMHLLSLLTNNMLSLEERPRHRLIFDYQAATTRFSEVDSGIFIIPTIISENKMNYAELIPLYVAQLENLKQGWMPTDFAWPPEMRFKLDEEEKPMLDELKLFFESWQFKIFEKKWSSFEKEWILFAKEKTNEAEFELIDKLIRYFNLINVIKFSDTTKSKKPRIPWSFITSPTTMYLWVKKTAFSYVQEILKFNLSIRPGIHDATTQTPLYSVNTYADADYAFSDEEECDSWLPGHA